MRCLGIDPGANVGIGIVDTLSRAEFQWVHGTLLSRSSRAHHLAMILDEYRPDLVAVESPEGFAYEHVRGRDLLFAGRVAGELKGRAAERGYHVLEAPAPTWRKAVCGNGRASDAVIARVLGMRVRDMPRTNAHVRDGVGVAAWAILEERLRAAAEARHVMRSP